MLSEITTVIFVIHLSPVAAPNLAVAFVGVHQPATTMQLLLRSPDGALQTTTISGDCTVAQLKMTVENETFVPAEFQRLVVASEQLCDEDACLSDCGLASGT